MGRELDLLFIHIPRQSCYHSIVGEFSFGNLLPMGVFALAELAELSGYRSRILHLQVEQIVDSKFELLEYLKANPAKIIALPLTWHLQLFDLLETARRIKQHFPKRLILLGGYTASFFHRELLEEFPFIDLVLRGEGEIPLLELLTALASGSSLAQVSNLSWRSGDKVRVNPLKYVAGVGDLDRLEFSALNRLSNYRVYLSQLGLPPLWLKGKSKRQNQKLVQRLSSCFFLEVGRGCAVNCTWCGGGREAHHLLSGRKQPVFISPGRAAEHIEKALALGAQTIYLSFDPYPQKPDFYPELFKQLRKKKLAPNIYFECWGLPQREFCREFFKTAGKASLLSLSPESGSEQVRELNKGYFYPNSELFSLLSYLEQIGGKADLTFTLAIPGEGKKEFLQTVKLCEQLRSFSAVEELITCSIELEPASPWQLNPEKFGIISFRRSLRDFYQAARDKQENPFAALGYNFGQGSYPQFRAQVHRRLRRNFSPFFWFSGQGVK